MNYNLKYLFTFTLIFSVVLLSFQPIINSICKQNKSSKNQTANASDLEEDDEIEKDEKTQAFLQEAHTSFLTPLNYSINWKEVCCKITSRSKKIPIPPPKNLM